MTGQEALRWRQVALAQRRRRVEEAVRPVSWRRLFPDGVEAHVDHFLGMDDPDANLIAMVKVKGTLGTATAKRLMLPGLLL